MRSARSIVLVALCATLAACSAFRHGWTQRDFEGQVLRAQTGRGADRLQMEVDFDSGIRGWVTEHGAPDYIHVESGSAVELCYIREDRLVRFERGWGTVGTASVTDEIPKRLHELFVFEDRQRLDAQREAARAH